MAGGHYRYVSVSGHSGFQCILYVACAVFPVERFGQLVCHIGVVVQPAASGNGCFLVLRPPVVMAVGCLAGAYKGLYGLAAQLGQRAGCYESAASSERSLNMVSPSLAIAAILTSVCGFCACSGVMAVSDTVIASLP